VSESAAWVEEEEMLGNTEAISFLLFTKWNTEKKKELPILRRKRKLTKSVHINESYNTQFAQDVISLQ
jgi:hypothetical protein